MPEPTAPTTEPVVTPEAPKPAPPAAPAAPAAPAPVERTFTQAELDTIIAERLARATSKTATTDADRIAALEQRAEAAEKAAISAIVARAAANAHDPAVVAKLVDLGDLTAADGDAIAEKVTAFLTANPWLVKADPATPPVVTIPAPGVTNGTGATLWSAAEMEAISAEELAADPAKMKLYIESKAALGS